MLEIFPILETDTQTQTHKQPRHRDTETHRETEPDRQTDSQLLSQSAKLNLFLGLCPVTKGGGKNVEDQKIVHSYMAMVRNDTETESDIWLYNRLFVFYSTAVSRGDAQLLRPLRFVRSVVSVTR